YGFKVIAGKEGTGTTTGTVEETKVSKDETVTFKAGNNLNINQNGKEFTYSLNKDITGLDKITLGSDGQDGKPGVSIDGTKGTVGINGVDGSKADITTKAGKPGVNGADGETITRIEYSDKDGNPHTVATLEDGLKFAGDNG
ncbi:hypothetical protein HP397_06860, partial [Streptobacillus felis]|nr:hypothetical protein [Streptobacillus felis]